MVEQSRDPATGISADFSASNAHAVYMSEIRRLKTAGIQDMEAASAIVRDRRTIARIRARELMDHIVTHKLHLKELFWEYDPMHKGIIPLNDFLTISRSKIQKVVQQTKTTTRRRRFGGFPLIFYGSP